MATNYENIYRDTPDALGAANAEIAACLRTHAVPPLDVLDIGCGQGRDALPAARLGHRVTGVDSAPSGIRDLQTTARAEGLPVTGVVADISNWTPRGSFDVLLIDRTLHMLAAASRANVLSLLLGHLRPDGLLLLVDEPGNLPGLLAAVAGSHRAASVLRQRGGTYFARLAAPGTA